VAKHDLKRRYNRVILARDRGYSGFSGKAAQAENLLIRKNMFKCRLARQSGGIKKTISPLLFLSGNNLCVLQLRSAYC